MLRGERRGTDVATVLMYEILFNKFLKNYHLETGARVWC